MNKVSTSQRNVMMMVVATALAGCASAPKTAPPPSRDAFIQAEMNQTIASVERSLNVLVMLERGDEGPRRTTPLGDTVAGAAGPNRTPVSMPSEAGRDTAEGRARIAKNRAALDTKVRLVWNGEAEELLRSLSSKVGYSFCVKDGPSAGCALGARDGRSSVVHIDHASATVEQVLRDIANQVNDRADVKVSTNNRRIELIYK